MTKNGYEIKFITKSNKYILKEQGVSLAGKPYSKKLVKNETVKVMTGALIPDNADAVIMKEMVKVKGEDIYFPHNIVKNQNIRLIGEDINKKEKQITTEHNEKSNNKVSSKKANKKTSNSYSREEVEVDDPKEVNPGNKLPKITDENQEIEITDEIDNSRRKRRRSSAIIE